MCCLIFIHGKRIFNALLTAAVIFILLFTLLPQTAWADEGGEKKLVITVVDETEYMQIDDEKVPLAVYDNHQGLMDPGSFVMPAGIGIIIGAGMIYSIRQKKKRLLLRQKDALAEYELAQQYRKKMRNLQ